MHSRVAQKMSKMQRCVLLWLCWKAQNILLGRTFMHETKRASKLDLNEDYMCIASCVSHLPHLLSYVTFFRSNH
jgi:hypothetical protein